MDVHLDKDARYPRSRACANQLYLPNVESREALHEVLFDAMQGSIGHHEQQTGSGGKAD